MRSVSVCTPFCRGNNYFKVMYFLRSETRILSSSISFPGLVSANDAKEAFAVGREAVKCATGADVDGSIAIRRKKGKAYKVTFERVPLRNVAKETRHMPDAYISKNGTDVSKAFLNYIRPIVGKLPEIGRFKRIKVKK